MGEDFPLDPSQVQPPVNPDELQTTQPQHIEVQTEAPIDVVQNETQTEPQAERMDESAEAFHGRMHQLMSEGRDIFVFRGAGTKNGIAEQDVPRAVEKIQATLQTSLEAGKKVAIMFDGDEDNRKKPDVGAIFGIVADSLKDNPNVVAIAAQQESWYYPDKEGGELKTATGTPYETFVFPDSTPGGHASLTQSKDLAQYENYKQFFVGPAGAIAGDQLRDLNEKAQGRPEDKKVEVIAIATHNNANLTQEFEDKAKAADEAGETAKADGFRATLVQRQEQPFGMIYGADGYKTFLPNEYPNVDIKFDESLVGEFQEMRATPLKDSYEVDEAKAEAVAYSGKKERAAAAFLRKDADVTEKWIDSGDEKLPDDMAEGTRNFVAERYEYDGPKPHAERLELARESARTSRHNSEFYDSEAEKIEAWAEILHDNPPTEAFKSKFEGMSVTPSYLAGLEKNLGHDKEEAERMTRALERIFATSGVSVSTRETAKEDEERWRSDSEDRTLSSTDYAKSRLLEARTGNYSSTDPTILIASVYGENSDEFSKWQQLSQDPNTTLGQLDDVYKAAVYDKWKPALEGYKIHQAFLDDIRSGRAANWQ